MSVNLSIFAGAGAQFFDDSGNPLSGGKIYSYLAGTTTPQTTYTSNTGAVAHTNPIILDAAGRVPDSGEIWVLDGIAYKFVTANSSDVVIGTYDNLNPTYVAGDLANTSDNSLGDALVGFRQSGPSGFLSGAAARTVNDKLQDYISIFDFIPQSEHAAIQNSTSTYDCYADIMAAINSRTFGSDTGPAIYFPSGTYKCSATIILNKSVKLYGDGGGLPYESTALIQWPAGVSGIIVFASSSIIQGLRLVGTIGTPDANGGHGIWLRARAIIEKCLISDFSGNGINVVASMGGPPSVDGNANSFYINCGRVQKCGGHGIYVQGADANAGSIYAMDCSSNDGYGFYDQSFLGNTYTACHEQANGTGGYKSDGVNSRNIFINCYEETGPSSVVAPSMVINGLNSISGPKIGMGLNEMYVTYPFTATQFKLDSTGGVSFPDLSGVYSWTFKPVTGRWGYRWANLGTQSNFVMLYDAQATVANGYARDITSNGALGLTEHYFGGPTDMKYRGLSTGAPVSGNYLQGDIIWNSSPTAGGYIGWVCVSSGNPGTWKTFGAISA